MNWTPEDIKKLRQRFGWSRAEMARHLGCKTETVSILENGDDSPDPEVCHQMEHLLNCVDANAQSTQRRAQAESRLTSDRLDQVHFDDLDS